MNESIEPFPYEYAITTTTATITTATTLPHSNRVCHKLNTTPSQIIKIK